MDITTNASAFLKKYLGVLTDDQYDKLEDLTLGIIKTLDFSEEEIIELDNKLQKRTEFNRKLAQTANLNNKGIELEKKGDVEGAISVYRENIIVGYPATYAFERLMIIYKKLKWYDEEIRVIEKAIVVFYDIDPKLTQEWTKRLLKARKLSAK